MNEISNLFGIKTLMLLIYVTLKKDHFFYILFYKDNYHKSVNEWVDKFFEKFSSAQFNSFSLRYDNEARTTIMFISLFQV